MKSSESELSNRNSSLSSNSSSIEPHSRTLIKKKYEQLSIAATSNDDYSNVPAPLTPISLQATPSIIYASNSNYSRSNSVNYRNHPQQSSAIYGSTTPATISAQANRKPSFKFEGTMLSRVQNMNVNKIKCLNEKDPRKNKLNNKSHFDFDEETIENYKNVELNKRCPTQTQQQQQQAPMSPSHFSNSYSLSSTNSHFMNVLGADKSNQLSLDSGIFLPSE